MRKFTVFVLTFVLMSCALTVSTSAAMDSLTINVPWERPVHPYIDIVERLPDGSIFVNEYVVAVPIDYGAGTNFVSFAITNTSLQIIASTGRSDYSGNWGTWEIQRNINLSNDSRYSIFYREQSRTASGTATSNQYKWVDRTLPISSGATVIGISTGGGIVGLSPSSRSYVNVSVVYAGEVSTKWELDVLNSLKAGEQGTVQILNKLQQIQNVLMWGNPQGVNTYQNPFEPSDDEEDVKAKIENMAYEVEGWGASIDDAADDVSSYLSSTSQILTAILNTSTFLTVVVTFFLVFMVVRKVIGR